ncbi:MAG: hypothetical protein IJX98_03810 [Clostridia bacterium]|nr:hypothetical protein [Clostridia bacterium]
MKFPFISDLDGYFCEVYANYDKLCILPGYRMPKMQDTRIDEFGRKYSFTLPADTMNLAKQEKKDELLALLKQKMTDKTFSFTFRPVGFGASVRDFFSRHTFKKYLREVCARYNTQPISLGEYLEVDGDIWKKIVNGKYYPSKNMIFSIALAGHFNYQETKSLLAVCGYEFEYEEVKDVVISYLLFKSVFNPAMVQAALEEYKLSNLFLKA